MKISSIACKKSIACKRKNLRNFKLKFSNCDSRSISNARKHSFKLNCCELIEYKTLIYCFKEAIESLNLDCNCKYRVVKIEHKFSFVNTLNRNRIISFHAKIYRFKMSFSWISLKIFDCVRFFSNELKMRTTTLLMKSTWTWTLISKMTLIRKFYKLWRTIWSTNEWIVCSITFVSCNQYMLNSRL